MDNTVPVPPSFDTEAILVALAPQLTWGDRWHDDGHGFPWKTHDGISPKGDIYTVFPYGDYWLRRGQNEGANFEARYPTQAAAKAACEHHYTTGKWE